MNTPSTLSVEDQKEFDRYRAIAAKQNDTITRLLSIMTPEEKKSLPSDIQTICRGEWSPAATDMAIDLIRGMIGEDKKTRDVRVAKWQIFWNNNPEIHF